MKKFLATCILLPLYLILICFVIFVWASITCLYPWYWSFETTAGHQPKNYKKYFKAFWEMVEGPVGP